MYRIITIAIFVTVFVIAAAFSAINTHAVTIDYYFGTLTAPMAVMAIVVFISGIIIGAIIIILTTIRLRYQYHQLKKKLAIAQQEINSLRILPLKNSP